MILGTRVQCPKCNKYFKPQQLPHHSCPISDEVHALIQRGNVTLQEYEEFRGNSWEHEAIVPALSNEALERYAQNILRYCTHNQTNGSRPCTTYDEAVAVILVPELLRRLCKDD